MGYYTLSHAVDTDETGSVDVQVIWTNPFKKDPNPLFLINEAIDGLYPEDSFFPLNFLELNKGAWLSDLMSGPFDNGFVVSYKLKKLIEDANIRDYKFYKIILKSKGREIKGYHYLHIASCLRDKIDYQKSTFYIGDMLGYKIKPLNEKIISYDQLVKIHESLPIAKELLFPETFFLSNQFPFNIDLFALWCFDYKFYISENFKQKLEENKITGVEIQPTGGLFNFPALA